MERWLTEEASLRRLPSYLRDTWRDAASKDALRDWLTRFADSDAGMALRRALDTGARREARFRVGLDGGAAQGIELIGAMDAAWREASSDGDGLWRVLDYKITLTRNAPPELYGAQMDFYALVVREAALHNHLPCPAVEVELVFLREGSRTVKRRVDMDDWDALRARALSTCRQGAAGPYPPNEGHCPACPWRKGCPFRAVV